jgi:hypothetical protein
MARRHKTGDTVSWKWGSGTATGTVKEVHAAPVERTIKGSKIKKNADEDNPAYLIEQEDGDRVLKERSELKGETNKSAGGGSSKGSPPGGSGSGGSLGPTGAELYEEAKKKDVEGRSSMDKAELEKAVKKAG